MNNTTTKAATNGSAMAYGKAIKSIDKSRSNATNLFLSFVKESLIPIAQSNLGVGEVIESFRQFFAEAFPQGVNQAWVADVKSSTRQGLSLLSAISGGSYTFRQGTKDKTSSTYRPFISWIEGSPAAETPSLPVEASSTETTATETATETTFTLDAVASWILGCSDDELMSLRSVILTELKRRADLDRQHQRELAKAAKAA